MCHFLAEQRGIVGIPVSAFYQSPPDDLRLIRFCFAKKTETLLRAAEICIGSLSQGVSHRSPVTEKLRLFRSESC